MSVNETVQDTTLSSEGLDRAIEEVLARPEFAWRLPRDRSQLVADDEGGVFGRFMERLVEWFETGLRFLWKWVEKVLDWLRDLLDFEGTTEPVNWQFGPQILLLVVLAVVVSALVILLLRIARQRRLTAATTARPVESLPDITDEDVVADQLPADDWMAMASDFLSRGEWRLAVRAMFLAALAHLAVRGNITIALYKSNREYATELLRHARDREHLLHAFRDNVRLFEEVWYGMHQLSEEGLAGFTRNQETILHDGE